VRLLTYVRGLVRQHLLLQNEYVIAENRILGPYLAPACVFSIQNASLPFPFEDGVLLSECNDFKRIVSG
jgi:hypothetical protein